MAARGHKHASGALTLFSWFGEVAVFSGRLFKRSIRPPVEARELLRQLDEIGTKSIPLVALAGAAIGAVLTLHTQDTLERFGAESLIPSLIVFSMIQESGPLITALVVAGRVGSGIGAELGAMKVTEQIDALQVSAIDPLKLLVFTRVLALTVALPLLTLFADACGILTGYIINRIPLALFLEEGFRYIRIEDFVPHTLRSAIFGLIIGLISCYQGMNVRGSTAEVGRATTRSVVLSMLLVIVADVILVKLIYLIFG